MSKDTELAVAVQELKAVGVKPSIVDTGSGHKKLLWKVSPDKETRSYVVASTGSDWRGRLNVRADVRRLLKADGVKMEAPAAPKPQLHKALEIPKQPTESLAEQVSAIRSEVSDLTHLVTEMLDHMTFVRAQLTRRNEPRGQWKLVFEPEPEAPIEAPIVTEAPPIKRKRGAVDIAKFLVHDELRSVDEVARLSGMTYSHTYSHLWNTMNNRANSTIERIDKKWRLKQA